jgi:hypothetical protein
MSVACAPTVGHAKPQRSQTAADACMAAISGTAAEPLSLPDLEGNYRLHTWGQDRSDGVEGRLSIRLATREDSTRHCPDGVLCKPSQEAGTDVPMAEMGNLSIMPVPWIFDSTLSGMDLRLNRAWARLEMYLGLSSHDGLVFVGEHMSRAGISGSWHAMFMPRNAPAAAGGFCALRIPA